MIEEDENVNQSYKVKIVKNIGQIICRQIG